MGGECDSPSKGEGRVGVAGSPSWWKVLGVGRGLRAGAEDAPWGHTSQWRERHWPSRSSHSRQGWASLTRTAASPDALAPVV